MPGTLLALRVRFLLRFEGQFVDLAGELERPGLARLIRGRVVVLAEPFGGVIKVKASESTPWWPPRTSQMGHKPTLK